MLSLIDMQHTSRNLNDKVEATVAKGHVYDDAKIELGGKKIDVSGSKRNESDFDFLKHHIGEDQMSIENGKHQPGNQIAIGQIDMLLDNERFREYKNKNTITIKPLSEQEIEFYRIQEAERYK